MPQIIAYSLLFILLLVRDTPLVSGGNAVEFGKHFFLFILALFFYVLVYWLVPILIFLWRFHFWDTTDSRSSTYTCDSLLHWKLQQNRMRMYRSQSVFFLLLLPIYWGWIFPLGSLVIMERLEKLCHIRVSHLQDLVTIVTNVSFHFNVSYLNQ
jgi:hypothetical protein